jgi:putative acyl-CoA dehydrogenase
LARVDADEHRAWLHALSWRESQPGAHVGRAALFFLMAQIEAGHGCPISMTHAAVATLRADPELAAEWEPRFLSLVYEPGLRPPLEKRGVLCGMAMTEKQGGSDVRANTTVARALGGGEYELVGHKWFCSAPMCDAFLVLAQAERGLSCFLLPRVLADGTRNGFRIERLKDKLGDCSNASSEIELEAAWARLVGEKDAACRRSSRWSTTPGSIASSGRRQRCVRRWNRRRITPPTVPPSGNCLSSSR